MPGSKFDDVLHDEAGRPQVDGHDAGPCAMGPVGDGRTLTCMQVWLFQPEGDGGPAFAVGEDGEGVLPGDPTFPATGRWMVRTGLEEGSARFSTARKATALATAMFTRADGTADMEFWSELVEITRAPQAPDA